MMNRRRILVTNDDGVRSEGILALANELKSLGDVTVVAPLAEASAWLERYRAIWEAHFERLDDLLREMQRAPASKRVRTRTRTLTRKHR